MRPTELTVTRLALFLSFSAFAALPAHGAPSLEAFSGAIGGNATCSTFGPPAPIGNFFGGGLGFSIGNVGNGIGDCGLAGGFTDNVGALSPQASSSNLTTTAGGGPFNGMASGNAQYGSVGALAQGTMNGTTGPLVFSESGAFGKFNDTLNYTSPTHPAGSSGAVIYTFTIHGNISAFSVGPFSSQGLSELGLKQDSFFQGDIFTAQATNGSTGTILGGMSHPGFTTGTGTLSGTGTFSSVPIGITFGTPVNLQVGLLAIANPDTAGNVTTDFSTTAKLTGIQVLDGSGHVVSDFTVQSGSGTVYSASGVVPEAQVSRLLLSGLALLGAATLVRRRSRSDHL